MQSGRVPVGLARVDPLTQAEAVEVVLDLAVDRTSTSIVVTPNIDHVVRLEDDEALRSIYARADLVVADGWPVAWAARLAGAPRLGRVTGADLTPAVAAAAAAKGLSLAIVGGLPGAAAAARDRLLHDFPALTVVAAEPAPVAQLATAQGRAELATALRRADPDIVFIGVGSPKQELLAARELSESGAGVVLCVGAAVDFLGGTQRRAPELWQRLGIEWLYRLMSEPARLGPRYVRAVPRFVLLLVRQHRPS